MKNLILAVMAFALVGFQTVASAHGYHRPPPHRPHPYPAPMYVTCFAQGLTNGMMFYGTGPNVFVANQWALYACQSTGQYCQLTGCRY